MAELREQIKQLWERFSPRQRWIMLGSALLLFISIISGQLLVIAGSSPPIVPLFTELESKDAGDVAARLQEMKIPYEIINNGTAISVSPADVYKTGWNGSTGFTPMVTRVSRFFDGKQVWYYRVSK